VTSSRRCRPAATDDLIKKRDPRLGRRSWPPGSCAAPRGDAPETRGLPGARVVQPTTRRDCRPRGFHRDERPEHAAGARRRERTEPEFAGGCWPPAGLACESVTLPGVRHRWQFSVACAPSQSWNHALDQVSVAAGGTAAKKSPGVISQRARTPVSVSVRSASLNPDGVSKSTPRAAGCAVSSAASSVPLPPPMSTTFGAPVNPHAPRWRRRHPGGLGHRLVEHGFLGGVLGEVLERVLAHHLPVGPVRRCARSVPVGPGPPHRVAVEQQDEVAHRAGHARAQQPAGLGQLEPVPGSARQPRPAAARSSRRSDGGWLPDRAAS